MIIAERVDNYNHQNVFVREKNVGHIVSLTDGIFRVWWHKNQNSHYLGWDCKEIHKTQQQAATFLANICRKELP